MISARGTSSIVIGAAWKTGMATGTGAAHGMAGAAGGEVGAGAACAGGGFTGAASMSVVSASGAPGGLERGLEGGVPVLIGAASGLGASAPAPRK